VHSVKTFSSVSEVRGTVGEMPANIESIAPTSEELVSKSHPKHYLVHKYWGRKAHNLVAHFLLANTKAGDLVLDPFMGSGGLIIEARKSGRHSIGVDLNPVTKLIVEATLSELESSDVRGAAAKVWQAVPEKVRALAKANCTSCRDGSAELVNAVWDNGRLDRVKVKCAAHGLQTRAPDEFDRNQVSRAEAMLDEVVRTGVPRIPRDELLSFVRRSGKLRIDELFSTRNLLICAHLLKSIQLERRPKVRNALMLAFSSMLPNVSAMIPANKDSVTGKSGWQISKFWVPKIHTEKNVGVSFDSRARVVGEGIAELKGNLAPTKHKVMLQSSTSLKGIETDSVDFVFTDPPYGDSIQYLGLSMFWNSWFNFPVRYSQEIVHDPYRKFDLEHYRAGLSKVFLEVGRVLKPSKRLVLTFNNREMRFWRALMESVTSAGFRLEKVEWFDQAVRSGTQGINRRNTLTGDFVYTFKNTKSPGGFESAKSGVKLVRDNAERLFERNGSVTSSELYCVLVPLIVKNHAYLDDDGKNLVIESLVSSVGEYVEGVRGGGSWKLKD
jgi:16S rRNA G966 N2-methylase RsmD